MNKESGETSPPQPKINTEDKIGPRKWHLLDLFNNSRYYKEFNFVGELPEPKPSCEKIKTYIFASNSEKLSF